MPPSQARTAAGESERTLSLGPVSQALCFLLMLTAIAHQATRVYVQPDWGTDKTLQAAAAVNLVQGHGLGYWYQLPEDLGQRRLNALYQWPPGYTLLLALPYWLANDINLAALAIDWLAAGLFFASWWFILSYLGSDLGPGGRVVHWLMWSATLAPMLDTSTGMLSLAFFSFALALVLKLGVNPGASLWLAAFSGLGVGLAAWLRYAYWPLGLVLPLALAYGGWRQERRLLWAGLVQGGVFAVLIAALILFQRVETGSATYLSVAYQEGQRGFWPEQLLTMCPFAAQVFRCDGALDLKLAWMGPAWLLSIKWTVCVLVLAIFALELRRTCAPTSNASTQGAATGMFFMAGMLTLLLTVGMLAVLTVCCCKPTDRWTYVQEWRYYAPVLVFVSTALCTWGLRYDVVARGWTGLVRATLVVAILYFPARLFLQPKYLAGNFAQLANHYSSEDVRFGREFTPFVQALDRCSAGAERVAFLEDPQFLTTGQKYALAALRGIGTTAHHEKGFYLKAQCREPVRVLAVTGPRADPPTPFQELLRSHGARWCAHFDAWNSDLYVFDLQPTR